MIVSLFYGYLYSLLVTASAARLPLYSFLTAFKGSQNSLYKM